MTQFSPHDLPPATPPAALSGDDLQALALALKLLGMAFYLPPSSEFLTTLRQDDLLAAWPLQPEDPSAARGVEQVRSAVLAAEPAALLPALRADFNALFVGPDHLLAPPWESVYLSREHLLFDVQTLQVRQEYARFGLQIPRLDREPDDHIGFELLFLSHLAELAAQALEAEQPAEAARCLAAAQRFLARHPQQWVSLFAERLEQHAVTGYYKGWGKVLLGSLAALDALLGPMPPSAGDAG